MPPQLGMTKTYAKEDLLSLEMRKTSIKEMITSAKGDASIMEMKNLHKGDDNLRIGDASIMEMKKECAKETFAIGVKISAKEIPSELKAKSSTIVSRYCFSKHGLN